MTYVDLFSFDSDCDAYNESKKAKPDFLKEINDIYNKDKNFFDNEFEREFPKNFFSRLWELYIFKKIIHSSFKKELDDRNPKGGPDFKIKNFKDNHDLYIECVCPQTGNKNLPGGNYTISYDCSENSFSSTSSGLDHYCVSRFSSQLKDKSEKFRQYLNDKKIIKREDYKMLCVLIYPISLEKQKKYTEASSNWPCTCSALAEFEVTLNGEESFWFSNQGMSGLEYKNLIIEKSNGSSFEVGPTKYLEIFDIIVACNIFPFFHNYGSNGEIFELYYSKEDEYLNKKLSKSCLLI